VGLHIVSKNMNIQNRYKIFLYFFMIDMAIFYRPSTPLTLNDEKQLFVIFFFTSTNFHFWQDKITNVWCLTRKRLFHCLTLLIKIPTFAPII